MSLRYPTDPVHAAADIVNANLNRLDPDTAGALEARRGHLRELALALAAEKRPLEQLLELLRGCAPLTDHTLPCLRENTHFLQTAFAALSHLERIELCCMLCAAMPGALTPAELLEAGEPLPSSVRGRIAYLRNAFTDRAYHAFSSTMERARSQYYDSYASACEAVSGGSCEACILPIEHAQDGKLIGFYRLIDRYELKIVCTCDIAQPNGTESRFALLKKNFDFPLAESAEAYLFELSITRSTGYSLGALLDAAEHCGLTVRRVDSIPLAYAEDSFACHTVLTLPSRDSLLPFLLYLTLDFPQFEPIGIYAHIFE